MNLHLLFLSRYLSVHELVSYYKRINDLSLSVSATPINSSPSTNSSIKKSDIALDILEDEDGEEEQEEGQKREN